MPLADHVRAAAAGPCGQCLRGVAVPPLILENGRLAQAAIAVYLVGQYLVYLFVTLHVARVLRHAVLKRDSVLDRMLRLAANRSR